MKRNYDDPLYKSWRLSVYKRDNYCCQWPGCKKRKFGLNAHHIRTWSDFPILRYIVDNGITLCKAHHKLVTGSEEVYAPVFMKIVAGKKKDD